MMQEVIVPVVVTKDGKKSIPVFPAELNEGDYFIVAKEAMRYLVPEGEIVTINGYTDQGPVITDKG